MVRTYLKLDWRTTSVALPTKSEAGFTGMAFLLFVNVMISASLAAVLWKVPDFLDSLALTGFAAMCFVSTQVLMEFGNIVISPGDYAIIGPRPVSSRTFFVAKLIHLLVYVAILSTTVSILPALSAAFRFDQWWAVPVTIGLYWAGCLLAAVTVINLYILVMKVVSKGRLERTLGYLQLVLMLGTMAGLMLVTMIYTKPRIGELFVSYYERLQPWFGALPSYWLISPFRLITEGWSNTEFGFALLGIAVLLGMGTVAVSYLSLSYAQSLGKTSSMPGTERKRRAPGPVMRLWEKMTTHEDRALLQLVRGHFKYDIRFRLGILSVVWMPLLHLLVGYLGDSGSVADPLASVKNGGVETNIFMGMGIIVIPFAVLASMHISETWKASWVFYSTPIDRHRMVTSTSRMAAIMILLPFAIFFLAIYTIFYGSFIHAVLHTLFLLSMSKAGLSLANILAIKLPFANDSASGNSMEAMAVPMMAWMFASMIPIFFIAKYGYGGPAGYSLYLAGALLVNWILTFGQNARIRKNIPSWEMYD